MQEAMAAVFVAVPWRGGVRPDVRGLTRRRWEVYLTVSRHLRDTGSGEGGMTLKLTSCSWL